MSNLKYGILFHRTLRFEIFDFRLYSSSLFFCFSALMIFPLNAREVELKVQDVTLYESSAGVLRSGKINLEPGINELMIRNLPVALQDESLVASVETAGASVVGSSTWIETGVVIHNKDVLELQKKIRVLEREIEDYESRNSNLGNLRRILADTRSKLTEMISKNLFYKKNEVDAKKWFQTLSGNRQAIQVVLSSDQEVGRTIKDLRKKLSELQDKLSVILSLSEKSSRITKILVSFTEAEKKEVKLNLTYRTGGVSWKPFYSVRMDGREKIEFEYLAEINQESGEDWNNINLLLSTSSPDISGRRPRLSSQRVYDQKKKTDKDELVTFQSQSITEESNIVSEMESPEAGTDPTTGNSEESGSGFLFRYSKPITLFSRKESKKLSLVSFTTDATFTALYVPALKHYPLIKGSFKNISGFPIIPGETAVFRQAGMVGKSGFGYISPGEKAEISFGSENEVRAIYRKESNQTKEGILSGTKVVEKSIRVELENFGKESRTISFQESIPVSGVENVKVSIDSVTTPGYAEVRKDSGILEWKLDLRPSQKQEIKLKYKVSFPAEFDLNL
ncbi:mucoidy inhibitor MuiA family protein [Leptospira borgpetersenii]|uniref:mucoidy inhibitor MuiA family protein n=1 Tax=Leptospira borgpetersenii TaxID=174 RepID=UPI000772E207|nr:mucoidy inhibitor MuiA family protein [Leptospira borgpetersenii]MBE8400202.1 mucoidy inhibitor MuiA family protein [Leptospira borgpetersenii serovar Tarassovi]MBE8403315.1 mucoidy inhibitor MuiA family protein [Leptospira borgpetersenii serovar Tarassovi]MBE8405976.1 mucoidy inhibitor MuiA family protein [Leptospira borgpetersenii serovar Tarassovi]MBE8412612.1 mucoidy inhibitor MuiA family protein [Leptospira borgpetersenii serovar Tarassovi]MBE8414989.1 mucoidy inhibitor MuiA family pro